MKIKIIDKNASENFIEKNKKFIKSYIKSYKRRALIIFFIGILFAILGMLGGKGFIIPMLSLTGKENLQFNLFISIGVGFFVAGLITFKQIETLKKEFLRNVELVVKRLKKGNNTIFIDINETDIHYKSFGIEETINWNFFHSYKIYDKLLTLKSYTSSIQSVFLIDEKLMSEAEFSMLLDFVKTRLVEEK